LQLSLEQFLHTLEYLTLELFLDICATYRSMNYFEGVVKLACNFAHFSSNKILALRQFQLKSSNALPKVVASLSIPLDPLYNPFLLIQLPDFDPLEERGKYYEPIFSELGFFSFLFFSFLSFSGRSLLAFQHS